MPMCDHSTTSSLGLFDDTRAWEQEPVMAFESLLTSPLFVALGRRDLARRAGLDDRGHGLSESASPISEKSAKVYLAMFRSYVHFLKGLQVTVPNATPEHIARFIESKERTLGVRQRYLRMLERIHEHMKARGIVSVNAASQVAPLLQTTPTHARKPELPTAFVSKDVQSESVGPVLRNMLLSADWRSVRDATMAAILLGAGLKVYELSAMRTSWLTGNHPDFFIEVPNIGVSRPHRVPLSLLAADCVQAWMNCRAKLGMVQPLMFVNSMTEGRLDYVPSLPGGSGGKKQSVGLDKSTVYRRIKAILQSAGIEAAHMGGRTLRNTYAVGELSKGQSHALVEERLGLRESKSLDRYLTAAKRSRKPGNFAG